MKKHENYQYSDVIVLRINELDMKMLKREAYNNGKKLSQYIRDILLK